MATIYETIKIAADNYEAQSLELAAKACRLLALGARGHASNAKQSAYDHARTARALNAALAELPREVAERVIE